MMEPELGRRPPPSAGESATTVSPRFGRPVPAIGLVLSQAADDAADGADANAAFKGVPPIPDLRERRPSRPWRNLTAPRSECA